MVQYIKFLVFGMMLLCCLPSLAQQKKTTLTNTKDTYKRTTFTLKENIHNYNYEVLKDGLYEVIVISPGGDLQSKPVKQQAFTKHETIKFSVNSKYWNAGVYRIIIQKESGPAAIYQLNIASDKKLHKK